MLHLGLVLVTAITDNRCIEKSWKERKTKNERKNLPVLNALVISLHLIINGADNYAKQNQDKKLRIRMRTHE